MKTVIAIPQIGTEPFRIYMKSKYTQSLSRAGVETRWIELGDISQAIEETLECDGLLLPGGPDIAPAMYGEEPEALCGEPNLLRDAVEPAILEEFLKSGKPILAICRGCQLLNVYLGGTLFQDISDTQTFHHSDFKFRARTTHPISIEKDSKLSRILGAETADVNSMHHQAARRIGKGLAVTARSADGFVECLELSGHPFCIGIQWHPEHMSKRYPDQQRIFDAFVSACSRKQNRSF